MLRKLGLVLIAFALVIPTVTSLSAPTAPAAPAVADGEVPDEVVVGFHGALPADLDAWAAAMGGRVLLTDDVLNFVSLKLPDAAAADRALDQAQAQDAVRYAQRDGYVSVLLTPNDPLYGSQWGWPAISAPAAWDVTLGSTNAKVAVLDTGIWAGHADLAGHFCGPHASFIGGEVALVDGFGHGTHVAGTVAARTNNGLGVAGTSQSCLMDVKVLSRFGSGSWAGVASGIRYAADNGAHIISMSLGGGNPGQIMVDAVKYAYNTKNVLVVAAAGNSGCLLNYAPPIGTPPTPAPLPAVVRNLVSQDGSVIYPAIYDEVQAVAALSPPDGSNTAGFSSCGSDVEIAAPGDGVVSAMAPNSYLAIVVCGGSAAQYCSLSGTSMATPHVSGVGALLKTQYPQLGAVALRCLLDLSADDDPDDGPGRDFRTGWGKLNARKALDTAQTVVSNNLLDAFVQACTAGAPVIMY